MSFFSDERAAELRELFFESAQELLQALNEQGLELEKAPADAEVLRGIRRTVHTLKGDSAACGFRELSDLAHELEDVLNPEFAVRANGSLADLVLSAADMFDAMLAAYHGKMQLPSAEPLRVMIAKLQSNPALQAKPELKPKFQWSEYDQLAMQGAISNGQPVFCIAMAIDRNCPMRSAAIELVTKVVNECGLVLARYPEEHSSETLADILEVAIATHADEAAIRSKCSIPTIVENIVIQPWTPVAKQPEPSPSDQDVLGIADSTESLRGVVPEELDEVPVEHAVPADAQAKRSRVEFTSAAENTLRVDAERIDAVMNLVGELIIGKSMLYQTINEFSKRFPKDPLKHRFSDAMSKQSQVLNALQRSVMKIRMVPVDQLFRRFPRVIRDTAKACGKDVQLVTLGADTDLDKGILDQLAEPLTHLVRNAVDHGIESASERTASGKSPQGFVKLSAYHQANHVVIEVHDDGRGIDAEKVARKAVESGLVSENDVERMTDQQKLDLIFESGLSTAQAVTAVSGRGVGMDVVRSVVARLKGSVHIISVPGKGTTFRLTLPLTLAIIKALLFEVGDQFYAIPLNAVVEITRANLDQVHRIDQCEVLQMRDEVVTLARLSRLMPEAHESSISKFFVVVVRMGDRKFGLLVDKLVGEDELVIKAMDDQLVATDLVSGASIMGDGAVVLILNIPALVDRVAYVRMPMQSVPMMSSPAEVRAVI